MCNIGVRSVSTPYYILRSKYEVDTGQVCCPALFAFCNPFELFGQPFFLLENGHVAVIQQ